jgi:hypothetical protein
MATPLRHVNICRSKRQVRSSNTLTPHDQEVRILRNGKLGNCAFEAASSDRRSPRLAQKDLESICAEQDRVAIERIGVISPLTVLDQLDY